MNNYNAKEFITINGSYVGYIQGGYVFHLENDDIIDFDQINPKILKNFNLKSVEFKNRAFEITYSEILDDLDEGDFVIFKLQNLKLL
ncbi:hypothetical protein [uncultured Polaribacter sp.]|uniref:hypothetical protein n=1 Tax=uncultured Polaribacter sp. TaxID=174711 RepID=UPI002635CA7B|nr:hypothetical protein [uncultured Polaribacter sp.]